MLTYCLGLTAIAGMAATSALVVEDLWRQRDRVWWTLLGRNQVAIAADLPSRTHPITVRTEKR